MIEIILGALILVAIVTTVICCLSKTPQSLRGYYGSMFWTIATIALVGVPLLVVLGFIL